jgi:hypothetical protein
VLKKVIGISAVGSCPYLVTKPSEVGVDADRISRHYVVPLLVDVSLMH